MIKIAALNTDTEEDSDSEEEVSREALEQIALQQYAKALELQRNGNLLDATQLIKDLLDTELLYDVKKPAPGEKVSGPLYNLKYVCYKNLAGMLNNAGDIEAAIDAYTCASELDDSDVMLWHKLGLVCLCAKHYERALHAFERGVEINPRHWPCIDKIVTLLLGLDFKEQCIAVIHDALELDPGYLRGVVYRRHIYTLSYHMKEYMEYLHPIYKWDEKDDEPYDKEIAQKLLKEADDIHETFIEQQRALKFTYKMPDLTLQKPIIRLTWEAVGESLVHMHHYITENGLSHAAFVQLVFEKEVNEEKMDVCEEAQESDSIKMVDSRQDENATDTDKNTDFVTSENENNEMSDKEKPVTDNEKVESDIEIINLEQSTENAAETKAQKKNPVRRRGSALSFLEQWVWCNKRRSGRKKTKQDTIYDILRRMVPESLMPELIKKKDYEARETSPTDLKKLFEEKDNGKSFDKEYFNTEAEQKDVNAFINKYMEDRKDIIDMLRDFLKCLSQKWKILWPESLTSCFVQANECYNNHIDVPACTDDNIEYLLHYTTVNLLVEEFCVNKKLNTKSEEPMTHSLSVINHIEIILTFKPQIYEGEECLEAIFRQLWIKLHIYILNKEDDFALDCLYQLFVQFEAMGDHKSSFCLDIVNFTFKPVMNEYAVVEYIKFLERNKKLSTVQDLYNRKCYEDVLAIIIDSFEHCKIIAREQDEEMSLDFAVQLTLILETYWALNKVDDCFRWSFICLHESLKHYFRYTSGSVEYEKWTLTVVKILTCMEHILATEGYYCLSSVSQKELSQGLEDLIRIIGHQMETNTTEMPFDTISPWIIMHYILQREEDQGRGRKATDKEKDQDEDVSDPLMLLFIAHEQLGNRSWCTKSDGKLLYFILDTIVPLLRTPALSKCLEQVRQYLEQCIYCLYGHPERKQKLKYLTEHNVAPHTLNWARAQQIYDIFRPVQLPALEGKLSGISVDTELLFLRILGLLPTECDPQKYLPQLEKYIKGTESKLSVFPSLLPYKMKDIYFLLGDHYFKKEDRDMSIKYNMLDIIINRDRFKSWAQISLAKAFNLVRILNSCQNLNNEREFLTPAKLTLRCYERSLELKPDSSTIMIEYGNFAYAVHSFCSRLLKQASELLSMEDFEALERQKENLLDTTQKCFTTVLYDNSIEKANDEPWLFYYMLGKVAEKRNKPPSVYMNYYMKGVKSLQESGAIYPSKINYGSSTHFCLEVLELHYRIHASILKYIEQHENKPIPASVGKVFLRCIEEWQQGPFTRRSKKENTEGENDKSEEQSVQAANILKRSISDAGEEDNQEEKKLKLEVAAAKVRRSASCDTDRIKEAAQIHYQGTNTQVMNTVVKNTDHVPINDMKDAVKQNVEENVIRTNLEKHVEIITDDKEESSSSSSSSSSDSSSSESSSDSSTDSGKDSDASSKSSQESKPLTEEEIMKIVLGCHDALEDCASRFSPHFKSLYRLAHYHFYYKKGKNIERCRDLMLSTFTCRSGKKLSGLFSERRNNNFFNNIWKIKLDEVDRAGSFAFHMNRSVLLTMEILKEIDDHKTLLDLSINLQRIPDLDKKYLRDSDREELAQQAILLCIQSLRGQVVKFSQQPDLKSNDVEREALKSLMLDIYRAYQRMLKLPNPTNSTSNKQFSNLLVDAYKLLRTTPVPENTNLMDLALKYGYTLKQQATVVSLEKSQSFQKKQGVKSAENTKGATLSTSQIRTETKSQPTTVSTSALPKMSQHDITTAFQNYVPLLNDYLSALQNISSLQPPLQIPNSFQAVFYRQFLGQNLSSYNHQPKKQKRGPKPGSSRTTASSQIKQKSFTGPIATTKATLAPVVTSLQKSTSTSMAPSMGTVLPILPASMTANLPSTSGISSLHAPHTSTTAVPQAHMTTASTVNSSIHTKPQMPHKQGSPGKTLQEKLAERQKNIPSVSKNLAADVSASLSRLPSSLTITKTSKQPVQGKKPEPKKNLTFNEPERPKPISSDEIIILDDD